MSNTVEINRVTVPAAHGGAIEVKKGQYVAVLDVKGGQCADFWAINRHDLDHFLSPPHCWVDLMKIQPEVGDQLVTNRRDRILTIIHDDVGWHDMLVPSCDSKRYEVHFGVEGHRNCVDNFREAMEAYDWGDRAVPQPFNIFMNTFVDEKGRMEIRVPTSQAGDRVIMKAAMDLIAASSSCPMDLNPTGGRGVTEIELLVSDSLQALQNVTIE
ncbi:MAG: urea carboxylase-associated family protein [Candidatus Promineifilaceae bacterium]|nr:urea carboxylase-associated family protein [Candidatus Promineifilaceae bacterium]